jgi:hypothetical protein
LKKLEHRLPLVRLRVDDSDDVDHPAIVPGSEKTPRILRLSQLHIFLKLSAADP